MNSDLKIWDNAAEEWSSKVTQQGSLRSVHLKNGVDELVGNVSGKHVLDAGCGDGVFTDYLSSKNANAIGIDGSAKLIEFAKKKYPKLNFSVADLLEPIPFENDSFDLILSSMVLMHLSDMSMFFKESNRILKPKGYLVFSILHPCFNFPTMKLHKTLWEKLTFRKPSGLAYDYFQTEISRRYEKNMEQELTHYHRTLEEYSKELNKNGFSINLLLEPHTLTDDYLKTNPKMEYTTRLPRFLFFKCAKQ